MPCYTRDESAQDAVQQPPHKKQRKHEHSTEDTKSAQKLDPPAPAKPAAASVLSCIDSWVRSCSPPEPPPTVGWETVSGGGQTALAVSGLELVLDRDWLPDATVGCHPPRTASQPCAPEEDPVQQPCEQARGESVGHWIDAALADEGWWGTGKGAQWSIWGGCFGDSDECFDPLLGGAYAEAQ